MRGGGPPLSSGAQAALKWLALGTMVLDHVHRMLWASAWPPVGWVGRLSFPLFALLVAHNAVHRSRRPWRYLLRLGAFALLSQPAYAWALRGDRLNIFATLGLGLLVLLLGTTPARRVAGAVVLGGLWLGLEELGGVKPLSFGFGGVLLVAATGAAVRPGAHPAWGAVVLATLAGLNLWGVHPEAVPSAVATLCVVPLVLLARRLPEGAGTRPRWPWLWYAVYPLHLLVLAALRDGGFAVWAP